MKRYLFFFLTFSLMMSFGMSSSHGQEVQIIHDLKDVDTRPGIKNYWLEMGERTFGDPILVPIVIIQGTGSGPTLGLTAGIHGNELNGIPIIHHVIDSVDFKKLRGRIVAIPGINAVSINLDQRRFFDDEDLNRNFPGKESGSRSQQYTDKINRRILPYIDIHIDMHTASFGRVNSYYSRADLSIDTLRELAFLQQPDIVLNGKNASTATAGGASNRTMRSEATMKGISSITVEYGNPQVFQHDLIKRGYVGVMNTLVWLDMYDGKIVKNSIHTPIVCKKSYWIYMKEGGFLDVTVALNQLLKKGELIGVVKNAFGQVVNQYYAPEAGIVIGKSSNPANMSGGRIIHLGILAD